MRQKYTKYIKWLLPVLFIVYYSNIIVFLHTHIDNGVTIVHSHPFSPVKGGASHHHNSPVEIISLHELSTVQVADGSVQVLRLHLFTQQPYTIAEKTGNRLYPDSYSVNLFLRAPPVIG